MVLEKSKYNRDYFGGEDTDITTKYGFTDYLITGKHNGHDDNLSYEFNTKLHDLSNLVWREKWKGVSVLDVGGAVGFYSEYFKRFGVKKYDVLDLNLDSFCSDNKIKTVDEFITGDALEILPTIKNDSYDVIFTSNFLGCFEGSDIEILLQEFKRVAKRQIHIINFNTVSKYYNNYSLSWWKEHDLKDVILIDYSRCEKVSE